MKRRKSIVIFALMLCLVLSACSHAPATEIVEEDERYSVADSFADVPEAEDEQIVVIQSATFLSFSKEDLMENSALVIYGRVIGRSEQFIVENAYSGSRSVFTDYYFEVYEVLRGETISNEIAVRIQGGEIDDILLVLTYAPQFEIGGEYLLFLTIPGGGPLDTPGYYYYIIGGLQGVFPKDATRSRGDELVFEQYGNLAEIIELSELYERLDEINKTIPLPTAEGVRQQTIENIRASVANNVFDMTEEEIQEIENEPLFPARIVR